MLTFDKWLLQYGSEEQLKCEEHYIQQGLPEPTDKDYEQWLDDAYRQYQKECYEDSAKRIREKINAHRDN